MSRKETAVKHIDDMVAECNGIVKVYDDAFKKCKDKSAKKALRKETHIARVKKTLAQCVAMRELLAHVDSLEDAGKAFAYITAITYKAAERETFVIAKDDDIMALLMRYDNFSMKKVVAYCEKHNIKFDSKTKTFDFSQCDDSVPDTYDDDDGDSE